MSSAPTPPWWEALVYAPIGVVVALRDDVGRLIDNGRTEVENRVRVAHWVGEMTVNYGRTALRRRFAPHSPVPSAADLPLSPPQAPIPAEPFHGYATMSAAEIVPLLARIPHAELGLVRDYEAATRARRTILARLDALQGGA